ncbi:MAG: hypothetical protein ACRD1P_11425 [Thermoanaerobaculia bacterium]
MSPLARSLGGTTPADDKPVTARTNVERPERVCPNCGRVLIERRCKLLCPEPACGYFLSCSDFY